MKASALLLLALTSCAVDQGVEVSVPVLLPNGQTEIARFSRKWAGGPVELSAQFDPETGSWSLTWKSDVQLDAAARASMEQARAQAQFVSDLSAFLRSIAGLAAGVPLVAPVEPRQEQGKGPTP